ncbi:MAG: hypothetical protein AB1413_03245 [Thermodesulfobacteriota bacterium]
MFLNSWSLALTLTSIAALVLGGVACRTAIRVLRHWNQASDSERQIRLEGEIWLSSTLVAYALGFQVVSLVLFVLAADEFCQVIVGAMCATGALLANSHGMPALLVKLAGVFFYGFWIVLHQFDIRSESYPLVRAKYLYLLALYPLMAGDFALQTMHIAGLEPDIITSCCAVVFGAATGDGPNLLDIGSEELQLVLYYSTMVLLAVVGGVLLWRRKRWLQAFYAVVWFWFFGLALVVITMVISSYIYAMPYHHCPFCILKPEYHSIGFGIYTTLIVGTFLGISAAVVEPCRRREGLGAVVENYQRRAVQASLVLLLLFGLLTSYHYVLYMAAGGEV